MPKSRVVRQNRAKRKGEERRCQVLTFDILEHNTQSGQVVKKKCQMSRPDTREGFTLIEVVIAILIFAVGIIGVAKMQGEAVKGGSFGMQITDAMNITQNQVELLMGLSYAHTSLTNGAHNSPGITSDAGRNYAIVWNVSDDTPVTGVKQVRVSSSWTEKPTPHQVTVTFIRGQP
ncbi:MAG: prepilin-type N-terminal cleavage/methylation domain-containing protein [Thermodesulfobacteriota bacterium]|nr:prepilin-type N-terminal cleavage/methylation domain-containing protein [Thermodesulfobacteriota bacterium]